MKKESRRKGDVGGSLRSSMSSDEDAVLMVDSCCFVSLYDQLHSLIKLCTVIHQQNSRRARAMRATIDHLYAENARLKVRFT